MAIFVSRSMCNLAQIQTRMQRSKVKSIKLGKEKVKVNFEDGKSLYIDYEKFCRFVDTGVYNDNSGR